MSAPDVLYHYCSTSTFHNIVANRSVRLSSLTLSNDSMEGRYIAELFLKACERQDLEAKDFAFLSENVNKVTSWIGALSLCLSSEGDMLSQWRGYADDAHGVSITPVAVVADFIQSFCPKALVRRSEATYR